MASPLLPTILIRASQLVRYCVRNKINAYLVTSSDLARLFDDKLHLCSKNSPHPSAGASQSGCALLRLQCHVLPLLFQTRASSDVVGATAPPRRSDARQDMRLDTSTSSFYLVNAVPEHFSAVEFTLAQGQIKWEAANFITRQMPQS